MLVRWELFFKFQGRRDRVEKNKLVFCLLPFVLAGRSVISPLTAINRQACSPPCPDIPTPPGALPSPPPDKTL